MFEHLQVNGMPELSKMLIIIIILIIVWGFLRQMGKRREKRAFKSTSLGNLRERYLRGDISDDEYDKQKKDLENNR
ncbi:MAG: SHOCT domain-containing protein [Bacteroidales bacterium]